MKTVLNPSSKQLLISVIVMVVLGGLGLTPAKAVEPEITELAHALHDDPQLIFEFVYDHIEYTPYSGLRKGSYMTLMDRSGNGLDQAVLLRDMLLEAEYAPQIIYGEIELTTDIAQGWLGSTDLTYIEDLMHQAWIWYEEVDVGDVIGNVNHPWVEVDPDGGGPLPLEEFFPAVKEHKYFAGLTNEKLEEKMGYSLDGFLPPEGSRVGSVLQDADIDPAEAYVQDLSYENLNSHLTQYSQTLLDNLRVDEENEEYSGFTLEEIIGGKRIVPHSERQMPEPEATYFVEWSEGTHESTISHLKVTTSTGGFPSTKYYAPNIYGKRVTLFFTPTGHLQLEFEGNVYSSATSNGTGSQTVTLEVNHLGYQASYSMLLESGPTNNYAYAIVNAWGSAGTEIIDKHGKALKQNLNSGTYNDNSVEVLGESLTLLGQTWASECCKLARIADELADTTTIVHHMIGICGQKDAPYIDMPSVALLRASRNNDDSERKAARHTIAGHNSAFEGGVIRQLQPSCDAVSTVKLMYWANEDPQYNKIFLADSTNYETGINIKDQLKDYEDDELDLAEYYIGQGHSVILPKKGDLQEGAWKGCGYIAIPPDSTGGTLAYVIGKNYHGGRGVVLGPMISPDVAAAIANPIVNSIMASTNNPGIPLGRDPINMLTGAYIYQHSDLAIGTGRKPFGLGFERSYSSGLRLDDGPMGWGWTHNYDVTATVNSNGFKVMGSESVMDAVPAIVQTYINVDILKSDASLVNLVVSSLSQKWLMDQMIDNVVTIKQAGGTSEFVKMPDNTPQDTSDDIYNPPPGVAAKLSYDDDNDIFELNNKDGSIVEFQMDDDEREGKIAEWNDPHGNKVEYSYFSSDTFKGELEAVKTYTSDSYTNPIRTLDFHYDQLDVFAGDVNRVDWIIDSEDRKVYYYYDEYGNLESFKDLDEFETFYDYGTEYGRLKRMTSPTTSGAAKTYIVENEYDTLDRVNRQFNAKAIEDDKQDDDAYQYYFAYYRSEEEGPKELAPFEEVEERFSKVYFFDENGNMTISRDERGRQTEYEYDGQQRAVKVTSPHGNWAEYEFDDNHNVSKIIRKDSAGENSIDVVSSYDVYEAGDRWFNKIISSTDSAGNETTFVYDLDGEQSDLGRLLEITYPEVYLLDVSDDRQPETTFSYNDYGQVEEETKRITYDGPTPVTTTTLYEYYGPLDDPGHGGLNEIIEDDGVLDITTNVTYDSVGNVSTTTDPLGNTTTYTHTASRRIDTVTDALGHETKYEYYPDGKVKSVKRQTDDSADWQITEYTYTPMRKVETVRGPVGSLAYDVVGGFDGTIEGATWTDGYVDSALNFDGDDDYVEIPDSDDLSPTEEVTVSVWVKFDTLEENAGIVWKGTNKNYILFHRDDYVRWRVYDSAGQSSGVRFAEEYLIAGGWNHIVGVFDGISTIIYLNGEDEDTDATVSDIRDGDGDLYIGRRRDGVGQEFFDGAIDEVVIFDRALSEGPGGEIEKLYNNGVSGQSALTGFVPAEYPVSYWSFDGAMVNLTQYEYDSLDRVSKVIDAEGKITKQCYYPDGQLCYVTNVVGLDDEESAETDDIYPVYNTYYSLDGLINEVYDAKANETTYAYDAHGRLDTTTYEDYTFEKLEYDSAGRLWKKKMRVDDDEDPSVIFYYDELNRVELEHSVGVIEYWYDLVDRQIKTYGGFSAIGQVESTYDNAGRLTSTATTYPYPSRSLGEKTVSYEYDAAGNRTKLIYPEGTSISYTYDELNRLTDIRDDSLVGYWKMDDSVEDGQPDDTVVLDSSAYANHGEAQRATGYMTEDGQIGDALGFNGSTDYVQIPDSAALSPTEEVTVSVWVKFDTPEESDVAGIVWKGNYNFALYREGTYVRWKVWYSAEQDSQASFAKSSLLSGWNHIVGVFDGAARLYLNGDCEETGVNINGIRDRTGNLFIGKRGNGVGDIFCDGAIDDVRVYNRALSEEEVSGIHSGGTGEIVHYDYDVLSARVSAQYANGASADYQYDMGDRLLSIDNHINGTTTYTYGYTYDNGGNRLGMEVDGTKDHSYYYDDIYRLTEVEYPDNFFAANIAFEFDDVGNRTTVTNNGTRTYTTNYLNQYESIQTEVATSDETVDYGYDDNGNLTHIDEPETYKYDIKNRLTEAPLANAVYRYGPFGRRIIKYVDGVVTNYVYDGSQVICEYTSADTLIREFVYGTGIDEVVRMTAFQQTTDIADEYGPGSDDVVDIYDLRQMAEAWLKKSGEAGFDATADLNADGRIDNCDSDILAANWGLTGGVSEKHYYYHYDGLGSVTAISDEAGNTIEKYEYSVYGDVQILAKENGETREVSIIDNPYYFTGRRLDNETGLYYYRARYYSPTLGRFLQTDPIGYTAGLNLYAYCNNAPVFLVDPFGLDWFDSFANFWAGAADSLSFGLTDVARGVIGVNKAVDHSGTAYKVGEYTEVAVEVGVTLGSGVLKTAARKSSRALARSQGRTVIRRVAGDLLEEQAGSTVKKFVSHVNPLFGHPGGAATLFPTGGLPAAVHSGRWNLKLVEKTSHFVSHRNLRALERGLSTAVNPLMTTARTVRNIAGDMAYGGNSK